MCGIAGIMMYPKKRTDNELRFIRELAGELAVENQVRGTHATGIATFGKDGYDVLKHDVKAQDFIEYKAWEKFTNKNITNDTYNILIHTRMSTQGSPTINDNNHPIVTATNIGIHNGMIYNDDSLFAKESLYRQAQVDSEVIFRLVDKEIGNDRENTKNVAEKLSGVYAVAFVKKENRNILNYFRNNNPTTFAYIPSLNITVFASLQTFIESALNTVSALSRHLFEEEIEVGGVIYFTPKENVVMQFDVTENTPLQQMRQEPLRFQEKYDSYSYYGYSGWLDDEDFYHDFRTRGTSTAYGYDDDVDTEEYASIYDFIDKKNLHHLMSDEDFDKMIELLDLSEKNEWSKGYKSGRESLDNDIELIKETATIKAKAN